MSTIALEMFRANTEGFVGTPITEDMARNGFIPNAYEENDEGDDVLASWIIASQYALAMFLVTNYTPIETMLDESDIGWAGNNLDEFRAKNPITYDLLKVSPRGAFALAALHGGLGYIATRAPEELEEVIFTDDEYTAEYWNLIGEEGEI